MQQGESTHRASERVAQRFGLALRPGDGAAVYSNTGFFLRELFSKVIFADRQLVQQYLSPAKRRLRLASFLGGVLALGLALSLWTWSYVGNRQFVAHVQADLDQAIKLKPEGAQAFHARGLIHQRNGDHPRAITDFDNAIDRDPFVAAPSHARGIGLFGDTPVNAERARICWHCRMFQSLGYRTAPRRFR